jgi:hypothetical protein
MREERRLGLVLRVADEQHPATTVGDAKYQRVVVRAPIWVRAGTGMKHLERRPADGVRPAQGRGTRDVHTARTQRRDERTERPIALVHLPVVEERERRCARE